MNTFSFQKISKALIKKEQDVIKASNRYQFEIHNMDLAIVNGIRRVILSEIPTLGFMGENEVSVKILKNNGPLHNEIMIHRIGMIPIYFSEEETEAFIENEYEFSLNVKNTSTGLLNVTTRDIKGKRNNVDITEKEIGRLFPVNSITKQPILITRLRQGEELSFIATVVKELANVHAAFAPVSLCNFFYIQDDAKNKDEKDILQRERNYLVNEYGDAVAIQFNIESELGLSAKYLVAKAIEILKTKTETIDHEIENTNSTKVKFEKHTEMEDTYDLHIFHETDTFGNLFQSLIYSYYIRNKLSILDDKFNMTYIGYYAPHPLDPKIIIRMTLKNSEGISPSEEEGKKAYRQCMLYLHQVLKEVYEAWIRFD